MELFFAYRRKHDDLLSDKVIKLPDAYVGVLAVELDEGEYREIAMVFRGQITPSSEVTHSDEEALREALFVFEEAEPRREFTERLNEFAHTVPPPSPVALGAYAANLARELRLDLDELEQEAAEPLAAAAQ